MKSFKTAFSFPTVEVPMVGFGGVLTLSLVAAVVVGNASNRAQEKNAQALCDATMQQISDLSVRAAIRTACQALTSTTHQPNAHIPHFTFTPDTCIRLSVPARTDLLALHSRLRRNHSPTAAIGVAEERLYQVEVDLDNHNACFCLPPFHTYTVTMLFLTPSPPRCYTHIATK